MVAEIVRQRTLVLKYLTPIDVPPDHPTRASLSSAGIVSVDATWQHEPRLSPDAGEELFRE